jgi:hypothetical protein
MKNRILSFIIMFPISILLLTFGCKDEAKNNSPPSACFTCGNSSCDQLAGMVMVFDPSCSFDKESPDMSLACYWDWESDGVWDETSAAMYEASHVWYDPGTYMVTLKVSDGELNSQTKKEVVIYPPPAVN